MSHNSHMPMVGGYSSTIVSSHGLNCLESGITSKQKRKPPGTPDPDAEVVYLSPETLMESDHYVCEICNQGFQREQNLQMHRRRHNVPWKLIKREEMEVQKRVYACPDPTCLHHDPTHALGDLVGIKKHFRRKHSNDKQWVCGKCFKGYAVQSDFKAHLKTCGTRGHSCDCGRVFSRVETFIKHQDTCKAKSTIQHVCQPSEAPAYLLQNCLSPSLSITTNSKMPKQTDLIPNGYGDHSATSLYHNFNLQLFTSSNNYTQLNLSLGSVNHHEGKIELNSSSVEQDNWRAHCKERVIGVVEETVLERVLKDEAREQLRMAMEENGFAEEKRRQAKWQIELAKHEFINAKKIREQALVELNKANVLKECAMKKINSNILQITCTACKREFQEIMK